MVNKSYVISGGTSGIGLHIVNTILEFGDRVLIFARDANKFEAMKKTLDYRGIQSEFLQVDFEAASSAEDRVKASINNFGQVDVLINNVGASLKMQPNCSCEDFMRVLQINLVSAHLLTRSVLDGMLKLGTGKIISLSSMASYNMEGMAPYVVAKGALDLYIRKSAMELSSTGVTHVGIRPGPVNIPGRYLTELEKNNYKEFLEWSVKNKYLPKKLCSLSEIEELIKFLVNTKGTFLNGSIINLGGGTF